MQVDWARTCRTSLIGLAVHGPLSHVWFEQLDRVFIVSRVSWRTLCCCAYTFIPFSATKRALAAAGRVPQCRRQVGKELVLADLAWNGL